MPHSAGMRAGILCLIMIAASLLQGCATQLDLQAVSKRYGSDAAPASLPLVFQNPSIAPQSRTPLTAEELRPGDIILTSAPSLASAGIQVFTLAPVSHAAIYIGDGEVVEAVRPAVRVRTLEDLIQQETVALALRHPEISPEQSRAISEYAREKTGTGFNYLSVTLHVPFSLKRRLCELPLVPSAVRDACIRSVGIIHYLVAGEQRYFCSQLVTLAYRHAGAPLTDVDPRLISPADILHMREGDVPSVRIHQRLRYVGHLKYSLKTLADAAP
jgi:hypothetical protein